MPAEALALPEIDAVTVAVLNNLLGTHRRLACVLGGQPASVRFVRLRPQRGRAAVISVAGRQMWLCVSDWGSAPPVRTILADEAFERIPSAIQPAILSAAFEPNLANLERLVGASCQIEQVEHCEAPPPNLTHVGLEFTVSGNVTHGWLATDAENLGILSDMVSRAAPTPLHPRNDLPIIAGVEIGVAQLSIEELNSLRLRDIVLFEGAAHIDKPVGIMRFAPQAMWRAAIGDCSVTLEESVTRAPWGCDTAERPRLTLSFEQGRVRTTAGEVAAMQSGASLAYEGAHQISISSAGQMLGLGEPVSFGKRVGVRLLQWYLNRSSSKA